MRKIVVPKASCPRSGWPKTAHAAAVTKLPDGRQVEHGRGRRVIALTEPQTARTPHREPERESDPGDKKGLGHDPRARQCLSQRSWWQHRSDRRSSTARGCASSAGVSCGAAMVLRRDFPPAASRSNYFGQIQSGKKPSKTIRFQGLDVWLWG
jgi:hypothetical protein